MKEKDYINELITALGNLSSPEEIKLFLEDLCSEAELIAIAERFEIAGRLHRGEMYSTVAANMDVSSTLIAKVDDVMKRGGGGFVKGLDAAEEPENCYGSFAEVYDSLT